MNAINFKSEKTMIMSTVGYIAKVEIPPSVSAIGTCAFSNCYTDLYLLGRTGLDGFTYLGPVWEGTCSVNYDYIDSSFKGFSLLSVLKQFLQGDQFLSQGLVYGDMWAYYRKVANPLEMDTNNLRVSLTKIK